MYRHFWGNPVEHKYPLLLKGSLCPCCSRTHLHSVVFNINNGGHADQHGVSSVHRLYLHVVLKSMRSSLQTDSVDQSLHFGILTAR